jgi:3-isopropylmalate dehydrogenase
MIQGGMGAAASGNIHPGRVSMFEPIHGSAPKYTGKNVASPVATVMAVQMMLDYLGETRAAQRVEATVAELIRTKRIPSLTTGALPTDATGDLICETLESVAVPA